MTRGELLTTVYSRLNKAASPDAATKARLVGFLNEVHRELVTLPGMQSLRDDTLSFASVVSQAAYTLPWTAKVHRIFETTNDRLLVPMSLAQYRAINPDPANNPGTPEAWIWTGYVPVSAQPSAAVALFIDSTSASDTGLCYVEGETSGGYPRQTSVTMTGVTAVNVLAAVTDWTRVTKVYLATAAVGVVTLHETASGGTELARIGIGQTSQRYVRLLLYPTPSAVITYTADVTLGITDLAQDTDVPRLPDDFHDLLVAGVMVREYEKTDDPRLTISMHRYETRLAHLSLWLHRVGDAPWQGQTRQFGRSRLGPWFEAGT